MTVPADGRAAGLATTKAYQHLGETPPGGSPQTGPLFDEA